MFQRIYSYNPITDGSGRIYRPRAYARIEPDLSWTGWLVFFTEDLTAAVGALFENQRSADALTAWAVGISPGDLESALERALRPEAPSLLGRELREVERVEQAASESLVRAASVAAEAAAEYPVFEKTTEEDERRETQDDQRATTHDKSHPAPKHAEDRE